MTQPSLPPSTQCGFWAGTLWVSRCLTTFSRPRYIHESLVPWGCEDSWTNRLGVLGPVSCQKLVSSRRREQSAEGSGGGGGSFQEPSPPETVPNPALEKSSPPVPDPLPVRLCLGKPQLEMPRTELWLAPGIIWLEGDSPLASWLMESFQIEMVIWKMICRVRDCPLRTKRVNLGTCNWPRATEAHAIRDGCLHRVENVSPCRSGDGGSE